MLALLVAVVATLAYRVTILKPDLRAEVRFGHGADGSMLLLDKRHDPATSPQPGGFLFFRRRGSFGGPHGSLPGSAFGREPAAWVRCMYVAMGTAYGLTATGGRGAATLMATVLLVSLEACGSVTREPAQSSPTTTVSEVTRASCASTVAPQPPFVPPSPYPITPSGGQFWYGTPALWTALPASGAWEKLPFQGGVFAQKVFWWRDGYSPTRMAAGQLTVSGDRMGGSAQPLSVSAPSNAFAPDIGSAMVVLIKIPESGCWEISGNYEGNSLRFVIWVAA